VSSRADGRIKLHVTATALRARREDADLYVRGEYLPLTLAGARGAHAFAFARTLEGRAAIAIVPRLTATLLPDPATAPVGHAVWGDTRVVLPDGLAGRHWQNVLTDDTATSTSHLDLAAALERFPVALFVAGD